MHDLFLCSIFDLPGRAAGSQQDEHLANLILDEFKKQRIDSWAEANYVQLQEPDRSIVTQMQTSVTTGENLFKKRFDLQRSSKPCLLWFVCLLPCGVPGLQPSRAR